MYKIRTHIIYNKTFPRTIRIGWLLMIKVFAIGGPTYILVSFFPLFKIKEVEVGLSAGTTN